MKSNSIINKLLLCFLIGALYTLSGCSPDSLEGELGLPPQPSDVDFSITPDGDNPNIIHVENTAAGFVSIWDFGNGNTARGSEATASYPVQGTYTITLSILTSGGTTSATKEVVIAETNPLMLDIPVYNFLTGGADALEGKTWIMDKETQGHMGIGPSGSQSPEWWSAPPGDKEGKAIYDDELTFKLGGFAFEYKANGSIYVNGGYGSEFPGATPEPGGGDDFIAPYTSPANMVWSMTETSPDKWVLTVSNGGHLGYYVGSTSYEILSISDDEMHIRQIQGNNAGNAWYQKFIRKGFVRPVDPPEYKIEDMHDDFEGTGNLAYVGDSGGSLGSYDNPAPVPINSSPRVGKYVKANGAGAAFANVQVNKDYKLDISERNVFKLKVFLPSYNDYTTIAAEDWQSYKTLQKSVSIKLQDSSLGGNAYTTQAEVLHTGLALNQWIELEFDFSAFSEREDFDRIVIQIGGEAIHTGGIFFIDDFELLP